MAKRNGATIEWGKWFSNDYYNKVTGVKTTRKVKPTRGSKGILSGLLRF